VVPESRVTSLAFVLVIRHEQSLAAAFALINAYLLCPVKISSEWSFKSIFLGNVVFKRRETSFEEIIP
jgi:hypothetical protein